MNRRAIICAAACILLLSLLSGCASDNARGVVVPTPALPVPSPTSDVSQRTMEDYGDIIAEACEAIESVRRNDLSAETASFEGCEPYSDDLALSDATQEYFDVVCALIVDGMPENLSAYDRYRYLAFVVSLTTEYDYDEDEVSSTAYGALIRGKGICLGYTNAFLYLCEKADLWCEAVSGYASWNGEEHGWNLVMLPEGSYYVDVTWCDQYGDIGTGDWQQCFMLTEAVLAEDHGVWAGGPATGDVIYG